MGQLSRPFGQGLASCSPPLSEVIVSFKALKYITSFIPGNTTGFVQVCDTVVNRSLKTRIEELADQYIDENEREWVEGKYTV
jgi:hypothetical protein